MARACDLCDFWAPETPNQPMRGECRRWAPQGRGAKPWPETRHHDWCGEFRPAPEMPAPEIAAGAPGERRFPAAALALAPAHPDEPVEGEPYVR